MPDADELRRWLVADLEARGQLSAEWRDAFMSVPRHAFIPDTVWWHDRELDSRYDLVPLRRSDDPGRWMELAYSDDFVVTQVNDGQPAGPEGRGDDVTSSASMPTIMALMLGHLETRPGQSVLEIGTGTGYNAALLAHHLGVETVTTIEVDAELADRARRALIGIGFGDVTVITGDGAEGHTPRAPYDRVISTAAVQRVPYSWVAQVRQGGRLVTPWGTDYENGNLLALDVDGDGIGIGRIVDTASFMWLREQRSHKARVGKDVPDEDQAEVRSSELHPYRVAGHRDVCTAIGLRVPGCHCRYRPADEDDPEGTLWLIDPESRSWASLRHHPERPGPYRVRQLGPRMLFDEVESAYRWWVDLGEPTVERWRFTVSSEGQRVWLPGEHGECIWSAG
ncbi:MAG: methyltransferase domain-containing protein [Pseudonocardiaceae bacterium]|nr:methyltransferase domain-containing protein [Pseudonocardiaceae bacterium]